jgi:hypothetical protein
MSQSTKRKLALYNIAALGIIALGVFGCLRDKPQATPEKAPMLTLTTENFSTFKESFNAKSDTTRIVALLSPT